MFCNIILYIRTCTLRIVAAVLAHFITPIACRTVLAGRLRALQELLHWFSERSNSALRDSHRAHTGELHMSSYIPQCEYEF